MTTSPTVDTKRHEVRWTIGLATYPMDAIYGAAYVFIDRAYVYLDKKGKGIQVVLQGKEPLDREALEALAGQFANELLHQVLRAKLAKRTGKVREMIVGRALFSAEGEGEGGGNGEGEGDDYGYDEGFDDLEEADDLDDDYLDDPLGIAVPWEEKYGEASARPEGDAPEGAPEDDEHHG